MLTEAPCGALIYAQNIYWWYLEAMPTLSNRSDEHSLESKKRRAALIKLGLSAAIAYTAPIIIRLDNANAFDCPTGQAHWKDDPLLECK